MAIPKPGISKEELNADTLAEVRAQTLAPADSPPPESANSPTASPRVDTQTEEWPRRIAFGPKKKGRADTATTQMSLESLALRERSQRRRAQRGRTPRTRPTQRGQAQTQKGDRCGRGRGNRECLPNECTVSSWGDGNTLELQRGAGCTILSMY